ncbi:MAG: hypothetical protein K8L97_17375 [Anaerolineae bacterium]|nr:hypothetical protein [Anaerolineae bacterium]
MYWYNKEQQSAFDTTPIEGMYFLIGALVQELQGLDGLKCPQISFPSGESFEIWDEENPQVHLFGGMELPLYATYATAQQQAHECAEDGWFTVFGNGCDQLELWSHETEEVFFVTYDNVAKKMTDVTICAA